MRRVVAAVLLCGLAGCRGREAPVSMTPRPVLQDGGLEFFPALSPEGTQIAYASSRSGRFEVYVREVGGKGPPRLLTDDGRQNVQPAWSPDGREVAYHSKKTGGIWVVPAAGGTPRLASDFGSEPAFSPDGARIAFQSQPLTDVLATSPAAVPPSTIWIVPARGGASRPVTKEGEPFGGHGTPSWTPDGKRIFFVASDPRGVTVDLWSVALDGTDLAKVLSAPRLWDPRPDAEGRSVLYGGRTAESLHAIFRLPLARGARAASGPPSPVTPPGAEVARHPTVSSNGQLAWSALSTEGNLWALPLSPETSMPTGPARALTTGPGRATWPLFSADGKRIAYGRTLPGHTADIWLMDADGGRARAILESPAIDYVQSWFPDGKSLFYVTNRGGRFTYSSLDVETGATSELPVTVPDADAPMLSPDGTRVAFHCKRGGITINTWVVDLTTGRQDQLTFDREFLGFPCWSPDGKLLAAQVRRGDDVHIVTLPSAGGTPTQLTNERGLSWPFGFSPDGKRIAFAGYRDDAWNVHWVSLDGKSVRLTDNRRLEVYLRYPSFSPSGDQVVYEHAVTSSRLLLLDAVPEPR